MKTTVSNVSHENQQPWETSPAVSEKNSGQSVLRTRSRGSNPGLKGIGPSLLNRSQRESDKDALSIRCSVVRCWTWAVLWEKIALRGLPGGRGVKWEGEKTGIGTPRFLDLNKGKLRNLLRSLVKNTVRRLMLALPWRLLKPSQGPRNSLLF